MILAILAICSIAMSNSTKFITAFDSLYSTSFSSSTFLSYCMSLIGKYALSSPPCIEIKEVKILLSTKTSSKSSSNSLEALLTISLYMSMSFSSISLSANTLLHSWSHKRMNLLGDPLYPMLGCASRHPWITRDTSLILN